LSKAACKIGAVVVAYNPKPLRFKEVISRVSHQVNRVVVVDNGSSNSEILRIFSSIENCDFIEVGFNSGVSHALNVGVRWLMEGDSPDFILLLDDDTIVFEGAVEKALRILNTLPESMRNRVGVLLMGSKNDDCSIKPIKRGPFSGSIVRADLLRRIRFREDFFLDQADFDFYSKVWEHGYAVLLINCKLIDHKLGVERWIPLLSNIKKKTLIYEPPWRYYYITRNSTILVLEGRMELKFYIGQLLFWGLRILLADGLLVFLKTLVIGFIHGLMRKEGVYKSFQ
jgi:rhamnosyltransferase